MVSTASEDSIDSSVIIPFALDIGGSLIKVVYFSRHGEHSVDGEKSAKERSDNYLMLDRLHFITFETSKIKDCLSFIHSKQLHRGACVGMNSKCSNLDVPDNGNAMVKATGGGAFKFADVFKETLGISIMKEDEMDCLVAGANFVLKALAHEAFTHKEGQKEFVQVDHDDLYPYLLVNIGSGVSMIKVDGEEKFQRVSGSNLGGGTFLGLGKLLTKCKSFDELLELSRKGDNTAVDMLVGHIYGGTDYTKIGLSASMIASSFGLVISQNRELEDYRPEDIATSLLRLISYNIAQLSCLVAMQHGVKRIFFGGYFLRGNPYTMDIISAAVQFWSNGGLQAMFLRHEGFLGALGAFLSYEKHSPDSFLVHHLAETLQEDEENMMKIVRDSRIIQSGIRYREISGFAIFIQIAVAIFLYIAVAFLYFSPLN